MCCICVVLFTQLLVVTKVDHDLDVIRMLLLGFNDVFKYLHAYTHTILLIHTYMPMGMYLTSGEYLISLKVVFFLMV